MDAVGAAAGLCCAARKRGKKARIVINLEHNAAGLVLDRLRALPEYEGVFTSPSEAFINIRPGALLVVVDTNRPDMVESQQLLESGRPPTLKTPPSASTSPTPPPLRSW